MSEPPRLDYRSASNEDDNANVTAQALWGFILTLLVVLGAFAGILTVVVLHWEYHRLIWMPAFALGGIVLLGLITLALLARQRPNRRGWAIGIWLGLGLGCLIDGLCFAGAF